MNAPARATGRVVLPPIRKAALPSGLQAMLIDMPSLPTVVATVAIRAGSAMNPLDRPGLAGLVAELTTLGTAAESADRLAERIDGLGASLTASAAWDFSTLSLAGLTADLGEILELVAAMSTRPAFPDSEVETLRLRSLADIAARREEPAAIANEAFAALLYPGHPYGVHPDGDEASTRAVTRDEIRRFHAAHWTPGNALILVAGRFDQQVALRMIEDLFGGWSAAKAAPAARSPLPPAPADRLRIIQRPEFSQTQIRLGHEGIPRSAPDWTAIQVMNYVLGGGGFASRLMDRIRVQRGYTYGITSQFAARRDGGPFVVSTYTPHAQARDAVREILEVVGSYADEGPTDEELESAKQFHVAGYGRAFETPAGVASALLEVEIYGLGEDYIEKRQDAYAAVRRADVMAAAGERLHPDRFCLAAVTDTQALGGELAVPERR